MLLDTVFSFPLFVKHDKTEISFFKKPMTQILTFCFQFIISNFINDVLVLNLSVQKKF